MRKLLMLIGLLLLGWAAMAQTDTLRLGYTAQGRVVDASTGRALESVHVSIPGRHQATVTNADGYFVLKSDKPIDVVSCSFLGYHTQRVATGTNLRIALRRENIQLSEASIISGDPRSIVEQGERGSEWNYDIKAVYLVAFLNFKLTDISNEFRADVALMDMKRLTVFSDKSDFSKNA